MNKANSSANTPLPRRVPLCSNLVASHTKLFKQTDTSTRTKPPRRVPLRMDQDQYKQELNKPKPTPVPQRVRSNDENQPEVVTVTPIDQGTKKENTRKSNQRSSNKTGEEPLSSQDAGELQWSSVKKRLSFEEDVNLKSLPLMSPLSKDSPDSEEERHHKLPGRKEKVFSARSKPKLELLKRAAETSRPDTFNLSEELAKLLALESAGLDQFSHVYRQLSSTMRRTAARARMLQDSYSLMQELLGIIIEESYESVASAHAVQSRIDRTVVEQRFASFLREEEEAAGLSKDNSIRATSRVAPILEPVTPAVTASPKLTTLKKQRSEKSQRGTSDSKSSTPKKGSSRGEGSEVDPGSAFNYRNASHLNMPTTPVSSKRLKLAGRGVMITQVSSFPAVFKNGKEDDVENDVEDDIKDDKEDDMKNGKEDDVDKEDDIEDDKEGDMKNGKETDVKDDRDDIGEGDMKNGKETDVKDDKGDDKDDNHEESKSVDDEHGKDDGRDDVPTRDK